MDNRTRVMCLMMKPFLLLAFLCAFTASACAITGHGDTEHPKIPSYAIAQDASTSLGEALADDVRRHPGQSGFMLLPNGYDSLKVRLAMVQAAEKTLDLQYYIVHDDIASSIVLEAILQAAERGVRVRFLIDGITLREAGKSLAILDHRKNIEIRVFNPIVKPGAKLLSFLRVGFINPGQALKRMHNKSLIADNQLAVTGGRNIGDEYFDENAEFNFNDLDTLSVGPITGRISRSFDQYWNDGNSWVIGALRPFKANAQDLEELRKEMKKTWDEKVQTEEGRKLLNKDLSRRLKSGDYKMVWAKAELTVDHPDKIEQPAEIEQSEPLAKLEELLRAGKEEFNAVSAYFVPTDYGVAGLKRLKSRGMKVRILTNALAATDVVAVHTGYERYRKEMLESGVELYEFKPVGGKRPRQRLLGSSAPPRASLHSKAYTIDGRIAIVGSYNLDPRSTELNTEIAIIAYSEELAAQLNELFRKSISPEQSYRVLSTPDGLRWVTVEDGQEVVYDREPGAGFGRKLQVKLMSLLPIEDQL